MIHAIERYKEHVIETSIDPQHPLEPRRAVSLNRPAGQA